MMTQLRQVLTEGSAAFVLPGGSHALSLLGFSYSYSRPSRWRPAYADFSPATGFKRFKRMHVLQLTPNAQMTASGRCWTGGTHDGDCFQCGALYTGTGPRDRGRAGAPADQKTDQR